MSPGFEQGLPGLRAHFHLRLIDHARATVDPPKPSRVSPGGGGSVRPYNTLYVYGHDYENRNEDDDENEHGTLKRRFGSIFVLPLSLAE
jgi:hypothetical protein